MVLKKFLFQFRVSLIFAAIMCIGIFIAPFTGTPYATFGKRTILISAVLLWIGLIGMVVFGIEANTKRKYIENKLRRNNKKTYEQKYPGCISFLKNKEATVADIFMFVFSTSFIMTIVLKSKSVFLNIFCLTAMVISIILHCVLNGRNYIYFKSVKDYFKEGVD